jgi:asparagine synthase (glutamine-hydrolysing)
VLLKLYRKKGRHMLEDLRGMYSFAIYDKRDNTLFMARDPYGIKPLYYADDGSTFRVGSQVKTLLAGGGVDTEAQPAGHVGFFLLGSVPEPWTLYKGIYELPAGHWMRVEKGKAPQKEGFADISSVMREAQERVNGTPSHVSSRFVKDQLLDSLDHHLVADVEVGMFLSSGLDSASLTALAHERGQHLHSVTVGFDEYRDTDWDEVSLAETIAQRYETRHRSLTVSVDDFEKEKESFFEMMDQPSIDGFNPYFSSRAASQLGLKAVISGLGGDELFGGYPSFSQVPLSVKTMEYVPAVNSFGRRFRKITEPVLKRYTSPKYAGLFEYGDSFEGAYLLRRGLYMPWELPRVLDPELVRQGWKDLNIMDRLSSTIQGIKSSHRRLSAMESSWYMRNQLLRDADWAGMAHSVEIRLPLVDWNLLQTLSPYMDKQSLNKQTMARTPAKSLPDKVMRQKKKAFMVPLDKWMSNGRKDAPADRGIRGWAKHVYRQYWGNGAV